MIVLYDPLFTIKAPHMYRYKLSGEDYVSDVNPMVQIRDGVSVAAPVDWIP